MFARLQKFISSSFLNNVNKRVILTAVHLNKEFGTGLTVNWNSVERWRQAKTYECNSDASCQVK